MTWLHDRYELGVEERLPHCWAQHPGLIEELWALKAWREEIYDAARPSAQAARYWHAELRQTMHAAITFYAAGCRAGHRGADGLAADDTDLQRQLGRRRPRRRHPRRAAAPGRRAEETPSGQLPVPDRRDDARPPRRRYRDTTQPDRDRHPALRQVVVDARRKRLAAHHRQQDSIAASTSTPPRSPWPTAASNATRTGEAGIAERCRRRGNDLMPTFSFRTEEFTLGALLYAPERLRDVPNLRAHHFGDPGHQAIFTALAQSQQHEPDVRGQDLAGRIARRAATPGVTEARLVGLALACPDPGHVVEEARLVIAQAVRRELVGSAERISRLTESLPADYPFLDYTELLGSLRHHAVNTGPDVDFLLNAEPNGKHPRIQREETLLADLIQHPQRVEEIATWLAPEAFTAPNRQDIYRTLLHLTGQGDQLPKTPFAVAPEITAAWNGTSSQAC